MRDMRRANIFSTPEILLIHHTRCGMLAFTDDLLRARLEGDAASIDITKQATGREFMTCNHGSASPAHFLAFAGNQEPLEKPLDAARSDAQIERLLWDV